MSQHLLLNGADFQAYVAQGGSGSSFTRQRPGSLPADFQSAQLTGMNGQRVNGNNGNNSISQELLQTYTQLQQQAAHAGNSASNQIAGSYAAGAASKLSAGVGGQSLPSYPLSGIRPSSLTGGVRPWMPTVQQVPAFVPQQQQRLSVQQQQLANVHDINNARGSVSSPPLAPNSGSASIAANQAVQTLRTQQMTGRTMVPLQAGFTQQNHGGARPSMLQNGLAQLNQHSGGVMRPASSSVSAGASSAIMRPTVRIPKLGTVATYNPATGVRSSPMASGVNGSASSILGGGQHLLGSQPSSPLVRQVSLPASHQHLQQQQQQQLSPHAFNLQHLQSLQNLRAGVALATPGQQQHGQQPLMPGNGQTQVVNVTLPNGTTTTAMLDQATISRLLEAQEARYTVMKVNAGSAPSSTRLPIPTPNAAALDVSAMHLRGRSLSQTHMTGLGAQPGSPTHAQLLQAAQTAAALGMSQQQQHNAGIEAMLSLQRQQQQAPLQRWGQQPLSVIGEAQPSGLLRHVSAPASEFMRHLSDAQNEMFAGSHGCGTTPGSPLQGHSAIDVAMLAEAAATSRSVSAAGYGSPRPASPPSPLMRGKEELSSILNCIGVELARHGITVDAALSAGWLGVLSPADVHTLTEVHAEEERRLREGTSSTGLHNMSNLPNGGNTLDSVQNSATLDNLDLGLDPVDLNSFNYGFFGTDGFAVADADVMRAWDSPGRQRPSQQGLTADSSSLGSSGGRTSPSGLSASMPLPRPAASASASSARVSLDDSSVLHAAGGGGEDSGDMDDALVTLTDTLEIAEGAAKLQQQQEREREQQRAAQRGPGHQKMAPDGALLDARGLPLDARFANLDLGVGFF